MTSFTPRPFIIPVFLPNAGCPHQCAFCNQKTITGITSDVPSSEELHKVINEYLSHKGKNRGETYIAFYGGNFMGLNPEQMEILLSEASKYVKDGQATGIRMSTRPDTITDVTLAAIEGYPVSTIETARTIADLSPDFVRIYPTVVLKNSLLARWYKQGIYEPMDLDPCVTLVKEIYMLFKEKDIRVIRMGLQETEDLVKDSSILAGPYHPAFGHMVYSEI
ncbi:MAG: hypothetical protein JRJ27_08100, partial [Deltaproteobacteria bacterium]|nr:hypothetical protein [Deltaproteobacteria bacterium]